MGTSNGNMDRKQFLKKSMLGAGGLALTGLSKNQVFGQSGDQPPNILILFSDDMTYHDRGNPQVMTPNLDNLADQGITFNRAFTSAPTCAPSRMSLYTGIHPVRNGAHPNHGKVYPDIKSLPYYLQQRGYRSAIIGKQHEAPKENFPFEFLGGRHHDNGKGVDLKLDKVEAFMKENKDRPWSLVVSSNQPHIPWNRGIEYTYDPEDLTLPPYLVDTKETREALARYYAEISYMDNQMGTVLQHLENTGQAENTIVMFVVDHGSNFPHCKWTCYDTGVRARVIMRWPGTIPEGITTDAIIQYVDILPTLFEILGEDPSEYDFDGQSFLPLLKEKKTSHRDYAYSVQTSKGIYDGPEAYGIRTVRSDNFRLIWNLNYENEFSNMVIARGQPYGAYSSWKRKADEEGDPFARKRYNWYKKRPEFELYDLRKDPYQLYSVADDDAYQSVKENLKKQLDQWMEQQGDKGVETELNALERQSSRWKG